MILARGLLADVLLWAVTRPLRWGGLLGLRLTRRWTETP